MRHKHAIIPIFVSHMGCPNDCVFCNQRQITGVEVAPTDLGIANQIECYLETIKADVIEIAFFGGSFTGIEPQIQEAYLKIAYRYKENGRVHRIRLSTRPDYINAEILSRLKKYGVTTIELGVQSFDESVLLVSKRGHNTEAIYKAVTLIKDYGFELGIQLMYGLPRDDFEKFFFSVEESIRLKADCIRLYPVLVIKNTELEQLYLTQHYKPATLEDTIIAMAMAVKRYEAAQIKVIRLGLQRTDLIDEGREVVAGPFHPALKELVYDQLFFEALKSHWIKEQEAVDVQALEIQVNPKQVTHILGHAKRNLKRCESLKKVVIIQSDQIELNTFKLNERQIISIMK
ncbi:elongator complex protein 3 [Fusibacter sp. 3D3]|uniref:elongator complex protein 3 n=1 Tax=Fusibacter sp. 3D3 TaxID=1048380 RepID=UPI0008533B3A|nr:radical SAM protein [Fusibacter sp. 3D3]GAU78770.1 oxygen-independent coproporphyrinogen III oxidase [Fusibacter sp. 3D3]